MRIKSSLSALAIPALFILLSVSGVSSQVPQSQGAPGNLLLADLLTEVRRIRTAIENEQRDAYRGLMLVERIRLQQEHVDRLAKQLDDVRLDLTNMNVHLPLMQERVKEFEAQVESERDAAQLSHLELELKEIRSTVEQQVNQQRLQQEREGQLALQLQEEQAKLNDLNDKLQAIDLKMEKQTLGDSPER